LSSPIKKYKKKPKLPAEVHGQDGDAHSNFAGVPKLCGQASQRAAALAYAKISFDFTAFTGLQPFSFELTFVLGRVGGAFPKFWPV
jgi:hypothetical protein